MRWGRGWRAAPRGAPGLEAGNHPPYRRLMRYPFLAATLLLAVPGWAQVPAAVSPPATVPAPAFYNPDEQATRRPAADVAATGAAVASSADPRATEAGLQMLKAGGTAADSAIAMMIALTVAEPQSSGIGGGAFLVWHDAATRTLHTIDGRERAPMAARPDRFIRADGTPMGFMDAVPGGYSVGVPGAVALAADAHRRWGRLPWAQLFAPSIKLARDGIVVSPRLHRFTTSRLSMINRDKAAAAVFLDQKGQPWPVGHVLRQPALADTLQTIAAAGPGAFYTGSIAADITKAVAGAFNNPAALGEDDLARYKVARRDALCLPYRQVQLCSMGPPSAGGIAVLQILKQLERFDLGAMGPDNLLTWHLMAESQRLAFADREAFGADGDFAPVPVAGLVDPAYLSARSALIRIDRAMETAEAGTPAGVAPDRARRLADVPGTSHMVAADAQGNVANLTSTIEGPFGSGLMAAGFMLNNEMTDFDLVPTRPDDTPAPNRMEPMKRPRSSMSPTMVLDARGNVLAAFGAAGGATIIAQVSKAIIAHVDWGLSVEEAIGAPQIFADRRGVRLERGTRLEPMVAGLKALGHKTVSPGALPLKGNGVARDGTGWRAAADPRSEGNALATDAVPAGRAGKGGRR